MRSQTAFGLGTGRLILPATSRTAQDGRVETYVMGSTTIGGATTGGLWQYANLMLDSNDDGELYVRRKIFPGTVALDISKE